VQEELDRVLGPFHDQPIRSDQLKEMKYLERCIKETLRLYPSIPIIGRAEAVDVEIGWFN